MVIGVNYIKNDKFVQLTGNVSIDAQKASNITIEYPEGLNVDNCVPVATGIKASAIGFNYVGKYDDSMDMYWGGFKRTLTLGNNNITLRIENPATEKSTFNYKIVLMKID